MAREKSDLVKRIKAQLQRASITDRKYERPMEWNEADALVAHIEALEAEVEYQRCVIETMREHIGKLAQCIPATPRAALTKE